MAPSTSPLKRLIIVLLFVNVLGLNACTDRAGDPAAESRPYWPTGGWKTTSPEEQDMNAGMLADMVKAIQNQDSAIDGVVVIRHGYLVLETYFEPFQQGDRHPVFSCTKSVVSALVGIAIDKGYIEGVDTPVLDFFPERTVANLDANKQAMTLEHVLKMATGFDCQDSYLYQWKGLEEMWVSEDWVQFVLDLPMVAKPGTRFEYCNGASALLSAILQETTGKTAFEFAQEHLFGPLGISNVEWESNTQGISIGYSKLWMTPPDMAKIGYLYLNKGYWDGVQVVPAEWVEASTRAQVKAGTLQDNYGYQWWVASPSLYMALGHMGQFIFVLPEDDMVVVFVSELGDRDFYLPQNLLNDYIVPAAK